MTTKVIFRKFIGGDVIALFPELTGDMRPSTCLSYMHIGQHGAASLYPDNTTPASAREFTPLFDELIEIGYHDLKICERTTRKDFNSRAAALLCRA